MTYIALFSVSSVLSLMLVKAIFVPSGDQLGLKSSALLSVSLVTPLPSAAFMTYISRLPLSLLLSKAIFVPSGDQLGSPSDALLSVSLVCPLPSSAFMMYISYVSGSPLMPLTKAICPFGPGNVPAHVLSLLWIIRRLDSSRIVEVARKANLVRRCESTTLLLPLLPRIFVVASIISKNGFVMPVFKL